MNNSHEVVILYIIIIKQYYDSWLREYVTTCYLGVMMEYCDI